MRLSARLPDLRQETVPHLATNRALELLAVNVTGLPADVDVLLDLIEDYRDVLIGVMHELWLPDDPLANRW